MVEQMNHKAHRSRAHAKSSTTLKPHKGQSTRRRQAEPRRLALTRLFWNVKCVTIKVHTWTRKLPLRPLMGKESHICNRHHGLYIIATHVAVTPNICDSTQVSR